MKLINWWNSGNRVLDIVNKERSVYLVMEYMDLNLRKYMMDTSPGIMMKPRIIKVRDDYNPFMTIFNRLQVLVASLE